jgi:hypothetical protein
VFTIETTVSGNTGPGQPVVRVAGNARPGHRGVRWRTEVGLKQERWEPGQSGRGRVDETERREGAREGELGSRRAEKKETRRPRRTAQRWRTVPVVPSSRPRVSAIARLCAQLAHRSGLSCAAAPPRRCARSARFGRGVFIGGEAALFSSTLT